MIDKAAPSTTTIPPTVDDGVSRGPGAERPDPARATPRPPPPISTPTSPPTAATPATSTDRF